jgi:hypothetical protein
LYFSELKTQKMKLLLPLLLTCTTTFSQKLVVNKTDEFTGKSIKETSVETLAKPFKMSGFAYTFAFKKENDNLFLNLRLMSMSNSVFSIKDGNILSVKMDNDSVIVLNNQEYAISKTGGAGGGFTSGNSQGTSLYFLLSTENIETLKNRKIIKIRVNTTDGYTEQDIKASADKKVKESLRLVL